MIIVAVSMAIRKFRHKNIYDTFSFSNNLKRKPIVYILLVGIGFYGGFIHVGIGFLLMFVLSSIGGMNLIQTNMHKVIAVVPYSIAALTVFFIGSSILWWAGLALAVGNMIGGWIGAHLLYKTRWKFYYAIFSCNNFHPNYCSSIKIRWRNYDGIFLRIFIIYRKIHINNHFFIFVVWSGSKYKERPKIRIKSTRNS